MEPIEGSETSAFKTQTPGKYPKENILHNEHGESLKSRYNKIVLLDRIIHYSVKIIFFLRPFLCRGENFVYRLQLKFTKILKL
jgi:hypothetical protein